MIQTAETKKETGKEQAKGNVPGQSGLGDRISGAADAVSGKVDESKYKTSADGEWLVSDRDWRLLMGVRQSIRKESKGTMELRLKDCIRILYLTYW